MSDTRIMFHFSAVFLLAMLTGSAASDAAATEERMPFIAVSDGPVAPPDSVEARVALRQHRESSALNRFTFRGNVLEGTGDDVDHWIVMFCSSWHENCQGLLPSYELLGVQWENKLNTAVMGSSVRFAKVDCATEKALCVSLEIYDYPSVVHYRHQKRVASWHGGAPGLVRFVKQELEGPKRRGSRKVGETSKSMPTCPFDSADPANRLSEGDYHSFSWRSLLFAFMLLAVARCSWSVVSASIHKASLTLKPAAAQSPGVQPSSPQEWARQRKSIEL